MSIERRPISVEDMLRFKQLADVQISPDGGLVACVIGDDWKDYRCPRQRQVWLLSPQNGALWPFSDGPRADHTPRWSPDGRRLAFLSDREPDFQTRIYLGDRDGGVPVALGDLPGEPSDLAWSPDGTRLAFLMKDTDSPAEQRRRDQGDDAIVYEGQPRWQRLWTVDLVTGAARAITGEAQIWEFDWLPDGGFVVLSSAAPYEWSWYGARLERVGAEGGPPLPLWNPGQRQIGCPRASPDGSLLAWLCCTWSDRGVNGGDLLVMSSDGGAPRNVMAGYPGSVWWFQWSPDGAALDFLAHEGGETVLGRIELPSGVRTVRWRAPVALETEYSAQHLARNGTFAAVLSAPDVPPELWIGCPTTVPESAGVCEEEETRGWHQRSLAGASAALAGWRRLTWLQPSLEGLALGETRALRWRAPDGLAVQGLLLLPIGYQPSRRVPLITWVHGGPASLFDTGFFCSPRLPHQLFAGAGFAVLLPNPRGSTGWGTAFTEANIGDLGGRDFADIMAGIDALVARGIADPERLGIGGWSYGGFMSAWAITQTARFRAAVVGAAITNWRSFHGTASIAAWDRIAWDADPYAVGGRFDQGSPVCHIGRARTPALILHGQDDTVVPAGQSYELFRALKDSGVPAELVLYPREGHSLSERLHLIDRHRRCLEWFRRFLLTDEC
ncbi:MAG TPA: S9 family peptidase [Roseiflexaceae bacterium]|nr:S9 family peptidase [Roseiflexaceae bacterium]